MIKTKRKNRFRNINLIMIAFVLFLISGCAGKEWEVSAFLSEPMESIRYGRGSIIGCNSSANYTSSGGATFTISASVSHTF